MESPVRRMTCPRVGLTNPSKARSKVVLPAPLGPITVTIRPSSTARSMPEITDVVDATDHSAGDNPFYS